MSGELLKVAAGYQGNMVKEFEEGNASVEEWWDVDEREKNKSIRLKNRERKMFIKPFNFQLHIS